MIENLKVALAQITCHAGCVDKNSQLIINAINIAKKRGADIIVFPELSVPGYTARDLWLRQSFLDQCKRAVLEIAKHCTGIIAVIGTAIEEKGNCYNAAQVLFDGTIIASHAKTILPASSLFEERRYFKVGSALTTFYYGKYKIGLKICEELWDEETAYPQCDLILCLSALPWTKSSQHEREDSLQIAAEDHNAPIIFVNALCFENNLILEGASSVFNMHGKKVLQLPCFEEAVVVYDCNGLDIEVKDKFFGTGYSALYKALSFSLAHYIEKYHKNGVMISLKEGIDSFLSLAIAVDTLGADKVNAFAFIDEATMPGFVETVKDFANKLNCNINYISTDIVVDGIKESAKPISTGKFADLKFINLSEQISGFFLASLAKQNNMVLISTVNKTELALARFDEFTASKSELALISDLYQTDTLNLLKYRDMLSCLLKESDIENILEHYNTRINSIYADSNFSEETDDILERYIDNNQSPSRIIAAGFDEKLVKRIAFVVDNNQGMRLRFPICPKVSNRSLIDDWHMPVFHHFEPPM